MKVLICDDSAFMRGIIKSFIVKNFGAETVCEEAEDGEVALTKFYKFNPDLVLLDIIMPKKDGIGVLKDIGKIANVVVISAAGQDDLVAEAKQLGAKNFISKPFDFKQLQETINSVLKG